MKRTRKLLALVLALILCAAMKEAFPNYTGENYLDMTAGALFPAQETAGVSCNLSNPAFSR